MCPNLSHRTTASPCELQVAVSTRKSPSWGILHVAHGGAPAKHVPKKRPSQVLPSWPSPPVLRAWEGPDLPPGHVFSDGTSLSVPSDVLFTYTTRPLQEEGKTCARVPHTPRDNRAEGSEARTGDVWVTRGLGGLWGLWSRAQHPRASTSARTWRAGSVPTSGAVPAGAHSLLNRGLSHESHRTCPPPSLPRDNLNIGDVTVHPAHSLSPG